MREKSLDFMKGMITILMIAAHIFQFFMINNQGLYFFSNYVNLTTFSAFLFCFGYVCNIAYFSTDSLPRKRIFIHIIKTLIAFYISAFGFEMIVLNTMNYHGLLKVLRFSRISGYSEFLLSFVYLYVIIFVFGEQIKKILNNNYLMILMITLSLFFACIPYDKVTKIQLSPLLGSNSIPSFPIVQYFSYFLIGAFLSNKKIFFNKGLLLGAICGSVCFLIYTLNLKMMPSRFPPKILWVIGGYFPVYVYYIFSKKINKNSSFANLCIFLGKKTLICLVVSNLILFLSKRILEWHEVSLSLALLWYFLFFVIIITSCTIFIKLSNYITKIFPIRK